MPLFLALVSSILLQSQGGRPTVAVTIPTSAGSVAAADAIVREIVAGLQADSLVEVVARPIDLSRPVRPAQTMVASVVRGTEQLRVVSFRAFDTASSRIIASASVRAAPDVLGDSLRAAGRRLAAVIARGR